MSYHTIVGLPGSHTMKGGVLIATPRRIRLLSGEILDHYLGKPYLAKVEGRYLQIRTGDYVGRQTVLTHHHVLTHPHLWERILEPFGTAKH